MRYFGWCLALFLLLLGVDALAAEGGAAGKKAGSAAREAIAVVMAADGTVRRISVSGNGEITPPEKLKVFSKAAAVNSAVEKALQGAEVLKAGAKVYLHDLIGTEGDSYCQINFLHVKDQAIRLAPNTRVILSRRERAKRKKKRFHTNLDLYRGRLRAKVNRIRGDGSFTVTTPVAVCGVRGTEEEVTHSLPAAAPGKGRQAEVGKTGLVMFEGMVVAKQHKFKQVFQVRAGQRLVLDNFKLPIGVQKVETKLLRKLRRANRPAHFTSKQVKEVFEGKPVPEPKFEAEAGGFNPGFKQAVIQQISTTFAPTPEWSGTSSNADSDPASDNTGTSAAETTQQQDAVLDPNSPAARIQDNLNFINGGGGGSQPGTSVSGGNIPTVGGTSGGVGR